MSPLSSRAVVATDRPSPYLKQLCKHFRHRHEVTWTDDEGTLSFPFGRCDLTAGEHNLTLLATADDDEALSRTEGVVRGHLERFGRREGLTVHWSRDAHQETERMP